MDKRFADWYRTVDPDPRSETLDNRWRVVKAQAQAAEVSLAIDLVRLYTGVPQSDIASASEFIAAFKAADATLPMRNNDTLVQVLAGATLAQVISYEDPIAYAAALALRSAGFAGQIDIGLLPELPGDVASFLEEHARGARAAEENPDLSNLEKVIEGIATPAMGELNEMPNAQHFAVYNRATHTISEFADETRTSIEGVREALSLLSRQIAELSAGRALVASRTWRVAQEELNILWWLYGESSRDLDVAASTLSVAGFAMVAGKELADLTTTIPGVPAARAMLRRALRATQGDLETPIALKVVVDETPLAWRRSLVNSEDAPDEAIGRLTPLHMATRRSISDGNAWPTTFRGAIGLKREPKLLPTEIANQVYTERLLARVIRAAQ